MTARLRPAFEPWNLAQVRPAARRGGLGHPRGAAVGRASRRLAGLGRPALSRLDATGPLG